MDAQRLLCGLCFSIAIILTLRKLSRRSRNLPLPPGPKPLPIIGNALDIPTKDMSAVFRQMSEKYGDVVHLDALGQPMIILGSHEAAVDLLEKRSANYSDRPPSTIASIAGVEWVLPLLPYGPWWRRHRRAFHQHFSPGAVARYAHRQRLDAHGFVLRLMKNPECFMQHIRHLFGTSMMRISYGIDVDKEPVDYLKIAEDLMHVLANEFQPGRHLVEIFPILRFLPEWMPGAKFKRDGKKWRKTAAMLLETPWKFVVDALRSGTARPSMAAGLIGCVAPSGDGIEITEDELLAKTASAAAYVGGSDTTVATLQQFFFAMATHPEVQKRAQAELDAVVGRNRLPDVNDMRSLPYLCALMNEVMRWHPITPIGVPHLSVDDDEYRGFFIPRGSIVIPNIWAFSRDPEVYPDPEAFKPERFLSPEGHINPHVRDPATMVFGYGRRICPGQHYAQTSLFITIATVLHALSITAPLDERGKPTQLTHSMTSGMLCAPEPFDCVIRPRFPQVESLLDASPGRHYIERNAEL